MRRCYTPSCCSPGKIGEGQEDRRDFSLESIFIADNIIVMNGFVNYSALLLIAVLVSISSFAQEPRKVPDGTEGVVLTVPPVDSSTKKLPPNEFKGSITSFRIGLGFIYDVAAYA